MPKRWVFALLLLPAWMGPMAALQAQDVESSNGQDSVAQTDAEIARLIQQLGDESFFNREIAQQKLIEQGERAFDALAAAQVSDDLEVAARVRFLIRKINIPFDRPDDSDEARTILDEYKSGSSVQARGLSLKRLALLPEDAGLAVLCRLVRYDSSPRFSRRAAVEIMQQRLAYDADLQKRHASIEQLLGGSQRTGAQWLRRHLAGEQEIDQPLIEVWSTDVKDQIALASGGSRLTSEEIVTALLRYQHGLLRRAEQNEQADQTAAQLVKRCPEDLSSLLGMCAWVIDERAFSGVDVLSEKVERVAAAPQNVRYEPAFKALLLYTLAGVQQARGREELAQPLQERAYVLGGDNLYYHVLLAYNLRDRGFGKMAEREFRRAMEIGPPTHGNTIKAGNSLAEHLHDQGRDRDAAEVLEQVVPAMEENLRERRDDQNDRNPAAVRSRMHYFMACHYESLGQTEKQIAELDAAIASDATDADALISLYRLKDPSPERRQKTLGLIKAATARYRRDAAEDPDSPENTTSYNQLAWLVGNTVGDLHEALQYSRKSLDLRMQNWVENPGISGSDDPPLPAAYLDTLGRCYYTLEDYPNAVKFQQQAVQQEPRSLQMQRQLKLFQHALEESEKQ